MITNASSNFSYQFRKDFDYLSYLEAKSHFDRVELSVESGIKRIIASNAALSQAHISVIDQLDADVRAGFENISVSLDTIASWRPAIARRFDPPGALLAL